MIHLGIPEARQKLDRQKLDRQKLDRQKLAGKKLILSHQPVADSFACIQMTNDEIPKLEGSSKSEGRKQTSLPQSP